jgi:RHS repeat-associated protein
MSIAKSSSNTQDSSNHEKVNPFSVQALTLPKGGGAIRGIGEKFTANPATGSGRFTIPIPVSPGRSGFAPELSLNYDSGTGNGLFGMGWSLELPSIKRKTDKGLPKYDDGLNDEFIIAGAEELVPVFKPNSNEIEDTSRSINSVEFSIRQYRPRIEGLFSRIERWTRASDGDVHWRTISKDNVTTFYGRCESDDRTQPVNSRVYDPENPSRVFEWLICQRFDDKGNAIEYTYLHESGDGVDQLAPHEANRRSIDRVSNRHIKKVRYGNKKSVLAVSSAVPPLGYDLSSMEWMFEIVFDYGEAHYEPAGNNAKGDLVRASLSGSQRPVTRPDAFSSYRSTFELRTYRRCERVLLFHHFKELETPDYLVKGLDFAYEDRGIGSLLSSVQQSGFARLSDGLYLKKTLPPIEFKYSRSPLEPQVSFKATEFPIHDVPNDSLSNLPTGVVDGSYQWADLNGEGISGILAQSSNSLYYKENLGCARLGGLLQVRRMPSLASVAAGPQRLMDLAGDGQLDVVDLRRSIGGFFERNDEDSWDSFRPFQHLPNLDWSDSRVRFADLTGDGLTDVLYSESNRFTWYESLGEDGFELGGVVRIPSDESHGPALIHSGPDEAIFLADMSGDGLSDFVRVRQGEVCYWPNLGYGRFGRKVTMDNSPWFDSDGLFVPSRVYLADTDGSGIADIIYHGSKGASVYLNYSGNSCSNERLIESVPSAHQLSSLSTVDLLGNGTICLVWSSSSPTDTRHSMRYVDLMHGKKPYLLIKSENNLGAETHIDYLSSTQFYLEDKAKGKPWITKLPFPVHVVARVETVDRIARNRFVARYKYHHGYFDGVEREFRGFGMVEQWDTEEYASLRDSNRLSDPIDECNANLLQSSHSAPVLTRTWFHTGAFFEHSSLRKTLIRSYFQESTTVDPVSFLEDSVLPSTLSAYEEREACRALRGQMIRQEVYRVPEMTADELNAFERTFDYDCNCFSPAADPDYWIPYKATEKRYNVKLIQPLGKNRHAVFFTREHESISKNYEPSLAKSGDSVARDIVVSKARIIHDLKLEFDAFGNEMKSVSVAYKYAGPNPDTTPNSTDPRQLLTSEEILKFQNGKPLIIATDNEYTNDILNDDSYRAPAIAQTSSFELSNYAPASGQQYTHEDFILSASGSVAWKRDPVIIDYAEEATGDRKHRLIERIRTIYRKDDLTSKLGFQELEPRALPFESYRQSFTTKLFTTLFKDNFRSQHEVVDIASIMNEGGYTQVDGDTETWWIPSGRIFYSPSPGHDLDPDAELAFATQIGFFQPSRYQNQFHNKPDAADPRTRVPTETIVRYDDYSLLVRETEDAVKNLVTAGERKATGTDWKLDYRVLQPQLIMDANGNRKAVVFDALGMVAGTAVMGKPATGSDREGDSLDGFVADLPDAILNSHLDIPRTNPDEILGTATTRIAYDLHRYYKSKNSDPQKTEAPLVYALVRESHAFVKGQSGVQPTNYQHSFSYSDGFGREIQKKILAEDGTVPNRDANDRIVLDGNGRPVFGDTPVPRWVGTGWTVFNNKGDPVRQYEPFFTNRHTFEFDTRIGVSPILFYDPLGRMIAKLNPNKSWEKVVIDSWHQTTWDANDTVEVKKADGTPTRSPLDDPHVGIYFRRLIEEGAYDKSWMELRGSGSLLSAQEKKVAQKTLLHANTPTTVHFDPLGREFASVVHNRFLRPVSGSTTTVNEFYKTITETDIEGNQRAIISDQFGAPDTKRRIVMQYDYDMLGNRIYSNSMDAGNRWNLSDSLGKPLYKWDDRKRRFHYLYDRLRRHRATDLREAGNDKQIEQFRYGDNNSLTDPELHNLRQQIYQINDQAGQVVNESYDFKGNLLTTKRQVHDNYQFTINLRDSGQIGLDRKEYYTRKKYDALDRVTEQDSPDGSKVKPSFNKANLLEAVQAQLAGTAGETSFVKDINYDAKGQRSSIEYGCGALTTYEYEIDTFRLARMVTKRGPDTIQDISYTYDPVGNISYVKDAAQQTVYFNNSAVNADNDYEYDASYRLVKATGREHLGQRGSAIRHDSYEGPRQAHPNDGVQLTGYTETYEYDEVGNIKSMNHAAAGGNWRRDYFYESNSPGGTGEFNNRLSRTTSPGTERYSHDSHGNMIQMPHLSSIDYDHNDQIRSSERGDGKTTWYVYDSHGQRVRKVTVYSGTLTRTKDRIYLEGFEAYKEFGLSQEGFEVQTLERETLHVMDDQKRVAMVERRTKGSAGDARLIRYQLGNHLGSSSIELKQDGVILSYEEYLPFGATSYQGISNELSQNRKRYRYTGKERDEETGLYYHGARYFASWLGRWTSVDPAIWKEGDENSSRTANTYHAMGNNPVKNVDLDGRQETSFTTHLDRQLSSSQGAMMVQDSLRSVAAVALEVLSQPKVAGTLQTVGGVLEGVAAGGLLLAPDPTMATKVAGAALGLNAIDTIQSGLRTLVSGEVQQSVTSTVAESVALKAGASETTAKWIGVGADVLVPLGASAAASASRILSKGSTGLLSESAVAAKVPSTGAENSANAVRLKNQLISQEIAGGHAFEKHIISQGEFPGWIRTRGQFQKHIESVLSETSDFKTLSGGKQAWWHEQSGTVVIRNPNATDGGTAFQVELQKARTYFKALK